MLKKSMLQSSDTVFAAPLGILCQVTYNDKGVISGLFYDDINGNEVHLDVPILNRLQKAEIIPSRISGFRGKSVIHGVISSNKRVVVPGDYPFCIYDRILDTISSETLDDIYFTALYTEDGISSGPYQISTKLDMSGFRTPRKFIVSSDISNQFIRSKIDEYGYPFVSGYVVFRRPDKIVYIPEYLRGYRVQSVINDYNESGYLISSLETESNINLVVPSSSVVRFNIQKGSIVLYDMTDESIVYSSTRGNPNARMVSRDYYCKVCGSKTLIPMNGYVKCSYENCMSSAYPTVHRMLDNLNLIPVPFVQYREYLSNKKITNLCDVFSLPEYEGKEITCSLSTLLDAMCPVTVSRRADFFDRFVKAAGSFEAVDHYIQVPSEIEKDLNLDISSVRNVSNWLENPENVLMIETLWHMVPNVHVVESKPKLDNVAQIFRNKNIFLSGMFRHGSYQYVSSILESYGSTIVSVVDNRCSCVVLGKFGSPDDQNVRLAFSYNIPVYEEDGFFRDYGIDEDIQKALS